MYKYKTIDKKNLDGFSKYLKDEFHLTDSTIEDYCKRIIMICKHDNIGLGEISDQIEKLCYDYTEGNKKELGARSHNSYKSALIKFKSYLAYSSSTKIVIDKKYVITVYAPTFKDQVGCAVLSEAPSGKVLNTRPFVKKDIFSGDKRVKEILRICWELAFDVIYDNKGTGDIAKVLSNRDITVQIEDLVTKSMKKTF